MTDTNAKDGTINKRNRSKTIKQLIIYLFIFVVFLTAGTILLQKSIFFETDKIVKFNEKSNLDYKVYLLENDFYEQEYLGKDMLYVASIIDKVLIDFDYTFTSEDKENVDFDYKIIATLSIDNSSNAKSYFKKDYVLLDSKKINMKNANSQNIKETINIDYQYYNTLANSFKNQYGVDTNSKLTVYMVINKKNTKNSNYTMDNISVMNVVIPLSERSIDIRLDYKDINETSNIVKKEKPTIKDFIPLIISCTLIIISIIMMIKAIRKFNSLRKKKSQYDKYISKILKEYDRLIAESSTLLSLDEKEIITITKFSELLDIHDNLQLPIMYYEAEKHEKSYFYINHEKTVYMLEINTNNLNSVK